VKVSGVRTEWKAVEEGSLEVPPFLVSTLVNQECFAKTLPDTGCLTYGLIDSRFVRKHNLQRKKILPREMGGFDGEGKAVIVDELAVIRTDIGGHIQENVHLYVVPRLNGYDVILGLTWFQDQAVQMDPSRNTLTFEQTGITVMNELRTKGPTINCIQVSAISFGRLVQSRRRAKDFPSPAREMASVFSASMADIDKALRVKTPTDPRTKLPEQYHEFLAAFDRAEADKLPPIRGRKVDHQIALEQVDGKEAEAPWGPLYSMSREELLVLRKTLTELLDKQFIRVSNSPASAPVLFVRKPGGGLRFCVDYRGLNKITRKDRYPLPLIQETLQSIGRAKWFTKLDVIAAFNKIRIAEGDEWKTAFRTRYGLYEWMVTPFGLANAPSTFQRYINWCLRDYLDEFCSAYVDDVLVYTDGSLKEHQEHVKKVLQRLQDGGLQLDIDKCEFEVRTTKYLGYIIEAGKGIQMDPEKIKAIQDWESPKSVRGVQSFLGFANFYRQFIQEYAKIALPISSLVRKDEAFKWTAEAEQAFVRMKKMFVTAPMLKQFDPEQNTILETDASTWSIGGTLMQFDNEGVLRPCAFYSKKNLPAECNYEIYDKEMLAIIRCLETWDAELRSVKQFQIRTDHKNLEYFMTTKKLTERQMRWSLILARYNFVISYIPGTQNERADALSRREQDAPNRETDDRILYRTMQLIKPEMMPGADFGVITAAPVTMPRQPKEEMEPSVASYEAGPVANVEPLAVGDPVSETELRTLWRETREADKGYHEMVKAVREEKRVFPSTLGVKVSIGECELSELGELLWRGRRWVPNSEPLRTRLIQATHDSTVSGHPGREVTTALMSRQFFWPQMSKHIRQFVRNCDNCSANKAWRDRKQGFLKPLPIPNRIWKEISMDFVTQLPLSEGCTNIMCITDRLGKGVILEACQEITADAVAQLFVRSFYRHHGLPGAIVSDRGTQFVGMMWTRVCKLLGIERRLSTAFHPETDGSTERMNQTMETYIRTFIDYAQGKWAGLLCLAELAINNRDAASTGVSPFFLQHGYHVEPIRIDEETLTQDTGESPIQRADRIVRQLRDAAEWAQSAMAVAQQVQEESVNKSRQQAPSFKVGDKVWLDLSNIRTNRPAKKLDAKYGKYTVTKVVSSHAFELDTPPGPHNVFHSNKLKLASYDPLPSQRSTNSQPPPTLVGDGLEFDVEKILEEKFVRRGRGRQRKLLVKWVGYQTPTWEPAIAFEDTVALDAFEREGGNITG